MPASLNHLIYVVTNCREPGVVTGYAEAFRRAGRRGRVWQRGSIEDAARFYETVTGRPPPPLPTLDDVSKTE